jgi:aspartyl-tRNA(Asn)/glutamyl-tRNA(Gln) amidotransferase subunit A
MDIPPYLTITEAARLIRARDLSPVDLTRAVLDRIAALNPMLNAYITVTADVALAQARAAEQAFVNGEDRGPLQGIPFAVKDLCFTAGIRTTCHSRVLESFIPDVDATCIAKLYGAGAVMVGKLALGTFATTAILDGPWPASRNPWDVDYIPGDSSSGSGCAVAAGLCLGALGSDTGGSIRKPAAYCGVVGLRPTHGRVSCWGTVPLSWSFDVIGPMTRSVADCAIMLEVIAGYDPRDPASVDRPVPEYSASLTSDLAGLVVGVDQANFLNDRVDPEIAAAVSEALRVLEELGATIKPITVEMLDEAAAAFSIMLSSESHTYHAAAIRSTPELYGPGLRNTFRVGALLGAADYLAAQRVRSHFRQRLLELFRDGIDLIAAPAWPTPTESFAEVATARRVDPINVTRPFSVAGVPAIALPCAFSGAGMPIGLQLAGRPFDEGTVLRAAHAYEQAMPWHTLHPAP